MYFNGGFIIIDKYLEEIEADLPADPVEIDKEEYDYFMDIFNKHKPVFIKKPDGYDSVISYVCSPETNFIEFSYITDISQSWTILFVSVIYNKYQDKYYISVVYSEYT